MTKHYLESSYKHPNKTAIGDIPKIYPKVLNIEIGEEIPDEWTNMIIDVVMKMLDSKDSNKYSIYLEKGTSDKNIETYILH